MTHKPRILILTTNYLPHIGGSELAIHHIAQRMTDYDFDVVTGRLDDSNATMETIGRVRVFRAGGRWSRATLLLPKILMPIAIAVTALRLMGRHRYVAVHAYQASQAAGAGLLVRSVRPGTPFIVTLQEGKNLARQSWLTRIGRSLILRRADGITAISNYLATYARQYSSAPVHIVPNGVDVASMNLPDTARQPHMVMSVSRFVAKNNVGNLIRAMRHVRATIPDATLVLVGSGALRAELEELTSSLELSGIVDFRGAVPHEALAGLLAQAGVFARPSLSEGLGSAFLEAMAARVPVVASPVGGIPDIVHDGETGLLCNPDSPEDIARAIVRLMADSALRERIVGQAESMVRTRYDWSAVTDQMRVVYSSVARNMA